MKINLHNYEEYFLLYADKELSSGEKMEVENFIQQHPHLEEEFTMINSTILEPETFHLKDKSFLLKSAETELINPSNYEAIFVLYHDGELTEEQKNQTEKFLEYHPELNAEFQLFSQARMQAESVSFPDKEMLLRKEQSGRSGQIILFRTLAAAAVLGFGLWIGVPYFSERVEQNPVAEQSIIPENPLQQNTGPILKELVENQAGTLEQTEIASQKQAEKTGPKVAAAGTPTEKVKNKKEELILAKKEQIRNNFPSQQKNGQSLIPNEQNEKVNEIMTAQIPPKEIPTNDIIVSTALAHVDVDLTPKAVEKNYTARNVVHLDVNKEPSGNFILNFPEEEFRKTKVGGFLKQLKRVVDRNDPIKRLFEGEEGQVASKN